MVYLIQLLNSFELLGMNKGFPNVFICFALAFLKSLPLHVARTALPTNVRLLSCFNTDLHTVAPLKGNISLCAKMMKSQKKLLSEF